jgi:ABC-type uncharacterized transport system permease subunit
MLKGSVLFLFSCLVLAVSAQQVITLKHKNYGQTQKFKLPVAVVCLFENGVKTNLILEQVKGDSLIFRKYYNQVHNFDCTVKDIKRIRIKTNGENVLFPALAVTTVLTTLVVFSTISLFNQPSSDAGDPTLNFAVFVALPISIVLIPCNIIFARQMLKKSFKTENWTINGF